MKAWLKGGLWGVGISVLMQVLQFLLVIMTWRADANITSVMLLILTVLELPYSLISLLVSQMGYAQTTWWLIAFVVLLLFFVIGALIGWIIGKIKGKR